MSASRAAHPHRAVQLFALWSVGGAEVLVKTSVPPRIIIVSYGFLMGVRWPLSS